MSLPKSLLNTIQTLTFDQLHELQFIVIQRLNVLHQAKNLYELQRFQINEKVWFDYHGLRKEGIVTKLNIKTAGILCTDGSRWKVAPEFLNKFL